MSSLIADRKKVQKNVYKSQSKGGNLGRTKLSGDSKKFEQDMSKGTKTSIKNLERRIKLMQSQNDEDRKRLRKGATTNNKRYQALINKRLEQIKIMQKVIRERSRDDAPKRSKNPPVDKNLDNAGFEGEEARRDKRNDNKDKTVNTKGKSDKEENKRTSMEDFKNKTISDGGPRPDNVNKNKKKRTMMKGTNTNLSKNNYGLNRRTGNYLGQR